MRTELVNRQAARLPAIAEGDAVAKEVFRMALALTANPGDAEEVSRRALGRAWHVWVESGAENASEPLLREVICAALDILRLRRGDLRGWLEEPLTEMASVFPTMVASREIQRAFRTPSEGPRLAHALDELVPLDRIILILREGEQISLDEAARLTGMSRREATLRLNRARFELQRQMEKRPAARATTFTIHFPGSVQNT